MLGKAGRVQLFAGERGHAGPFDEVRIYRADPAGIAGLREGDLAGIKDGNYLRVPAPEASLVQDDPPPPGDDAGHEETGSVRVAFRPAVPSFSASFQA